jgi:hypothetical protein
MCEVDAGETVRLRLGRKAKHGLKFQDEKVATKRCFLERGSSVPRAPGLGFRSLIVPRREDDSRSWERSNFQQIRAHARTYFLVSWISIGFAKKSPARSAYPHVFCYLPTGASVAPLWGHQATACRRIHHNHRRHMHVAC